MSLLCIGLLIMLYVHDLFMLYSWFQRLNFRLLFYMSPSPSTFMYYGPTSCFPLSVTAEVLPWDPGMEWQGLAAISS